MVTSNPSQKKGGIVKPIIIGIIVLLVLIVALGGTLAMSANRALGLVENARQAYSEAISSLEDGNFEGAYASARSAVDSMSALPKEFEGPQWSIAAALPVLGDDVKIAREMSSIAGRLADEAVSPLFDQWDSITQTLSGDGGLNYVERASALLEELPKFAKTITHAKQVVYECEERANSLPVAHIDQLNDAASELKETMESIADMLRVFDRVADAVSP